MKLITNIILGIIKLALAMGLAGETHDIPRSGGELSETEKRRITGLRYLLVR